MGVNTSSKSVKMICKKDLRVKQNNSAAELLREINEIYNLTWAGDSDNMLNQKKVTCLGGQKCFVTLRMNNVVVK